MQNILKEDIDYTFNRLSDVERVKFKDSTILITGCGGFLGYYFMHFFDAKAELLGLKKVVKSSRVSDIF